MGCAQSSGIVIATRTELIDTQPESVKYQLKLSIKRDDPILFQLVMKKYNISLQEKINDGFDTNWTFLHFAAAKNAANVIEEFLVSNLSASQLAFDIVNARDIGGNTPLQTAFDYSCFEAFEALLVNCAKFDHKVNIRNEFVRNIPEDSNFMHVIKDYKSKSIQLERQSGSKIDTTKDSTDYINILNRGQVDDKTILSQIKEKESFKDKDFWQSNNEILKDIPSLASKLDKDTKISWTSLDKINKDLKIFSTGGFNPAIEVSSINPNLNYLFCALNEYPSSLQRILISLERKEQGVLSLVLYKNGRPNVILLDEYFPFSKAKDSLIFQKPFEHDCWPMILEKGLAKLYGDYSKIAKLQLPELLENILGAPVKSFKISDNSIDFFWMILQDLIHGNCLTFFGLKEQKEVYFFLTDIFSVNERRIIKLRACFPGSKINSVAPESILDEEGKPIVDIENKEEGYYFVDLEEFAKQFENVVVSHYNQNWTRNAQVIKNLKSKAETFELEIKKESKVFISFVQKPEEGSAPPPLHFVLIQREGKILQTIAEGDSNCQTGAKTCYIKDEESLNLEPGKYLIQVKKVAKSNKSNIHEGTLIVYSSQPVDLTPVSNKNILEDILISLGESTSLKEPCGAGCEFTSGWFSIYHWLYFENNSASKWEVEIKFESLVNIKLGKLHQHSPDSFHIIVEKGQKKVVYLEKKDPSKNSDFKLDMNHIFE